jgi:toxin-antitoxin system PIN domain toxin
MLVIDINVLIAAHRHDYSNHKIAKKWLENIMAEGEQIIIPDLVWVGFARIASNSRILKPPSTDIEISSFIEAVTSYKNYIPYAGLRKDITYFERFRVANQATGNLVTDAYIAAICYENSCPIATFDRDFRLFNNINIVTPTG